LLIFEIVILALTVLTGVSIVWSTLILGISPMPSSKKARQTMLELTDETGTGPIFELGSGWGNLLIPLAKKYPQRKIVGYELSLMPWLTSILLKKAFGLKNLQVYRQNFMRADLSDASVIFCYLFPGGMLGVENKLNAEKGQLEYLISNSFALPSHKPIKTVQLNDIYKSLVYLYEFNRTDK